METLNPKQKEAAEYPGGPLLIVAGAGSGKTKTLTSRIAYLIASGVKPERILAITFTNKAAKEMADRVAKLESWNLKPATDGTNGKDSIRQPADKFQAPFIGTFHSWGARVLKANASLLGRTANFSIFDEDDALRLLKEVMKAAGVDKDRFSPPMLRGRIGKIKNELGSAEELRETGKYGDDIAADVFERYEAALAKNNAFDFDDLIEKVVRLMQKHPAVLAALQNAYDHVLVDEYQDINTGQYRLIKLLVQNHKNLSVVGDDAQSIYAFRGSDFRNFLNFDRDWPSAKIVKLEENYRSTANIITAASHVIGNNKMQKPKNLWTKNPTGSVVSIVGLPHDEEEAYFIVGRITALFRDKNADPQAAVLYRTNAQSRAIEQALMQSGIPYRIYGGLRFYERMEIKDMLVCLRYAFNPADSVSLDRINKNFGKKEAAVLIAELPRLAEKLQPTELINFFLEHTRYMEYLEKSFKNARERVENVKELIAFAGNYNELGLGAFLEQVSLVSSLDMPNGRLGAKSKNGAVVNLMTIHASKGLEFNNVFVAGCNEGVLPHEQSMFDDDQVEEERRLMYVAMTRARLGLTLTFYGVPSRFLYEIPTEFATFEDKSRSRGLSELPDEDERYIEYD